MRAMKSRDLADRSDEERDSVCILPAVKQTAFLSILWKCHRKRNPEIRERAQYALLTVRIRSKPHEHSFFIDYAKYSNFFILINLGTYMRSILNFIHHRKNGNTDVLADWNKYLIFQDFLKCSEHFLCILVAFHSIAKCRDLKEPLQTRISLV